MQQPPDGQSQGQSGWRKKRYIISAAASVVAVGLIVGLSVGLRSGGGNGASGASNNDAGTRRSLYPPPPVDGMQVRGLATLHDSKWRCDIAFSILGSISQYF